MELACIGLGSNIGDREANIRRAIEAISTWGAVEKVSSLYETEPEGFTDQPDFLNGAVCISTDLNAMKLLKKLKQIERNMGRKESFRDAPRIIDLDILVFGDQVVKNPGLDVPHPRLHLRAFVLIPMVEIMPSFVHPVLGKTMKELLENLKTPKRVVKYNSPEAKLREG